MAGLCRMRLLIVLCVFCFFLAQNHIDPESFRPEFAVSASTTQAAPDEARPTASIKSQDRFQSADTVGLAVELEPEIEVPADQPSETARRKVSVAEMCDTLATAAQSTNLPVGFLIRLIWQESGFDSSIVSRAGAQGVAQFMPGTAAEWGLRDPFDPLQSLAASARMLQSLHQQFGNLGLAAAAYNAGSGRIQNWLTKRGKLPDETRSYVLNITGHPAETWVKAAPRSINFRIPRRAPCQEVAAAADAETVPLPPVRSAPHSVVYASAEKSSGERLRDALPKIAAPAAIIRLDPPSGHGMHKRQQLALTIKRAAPAQEKAPLHLAKFTARKDVSAKPAAKSQKRGRVQVAMATRGGK
jgi:hypothetical protein